MSGSHLSPAHAHLSPALRVGVAVLSWADKLGRPPLQTQIHWLLKHSHQENEESLKLFNNINKMSVEFYRK